MAEQKASSEDYNNMVEYYTVWAHQIKTPIAAMRLNLQSEDTESARRLMGDLNRIEAYVEMVLTFLRLDSDNTDYLIKEYDIDEIIRPAIRKFSREFILKKLKLEYEPVRLQDDHRFKMAVLHHRTDNIQCGQIHLRRIGAHLYG